MYSFFELSGNLGARIAAATGSLILTIGLLTAAFIPATPALALSIGALA